LERLIYKIAGEDASVNAAMMKSLSADGKYTITDDMRAKLGDFFGGYATETETIEIIKHIYENCSYVIDTHTAVASCVYEQYKKASGDVGTKTVIASTASPYKFTRSVMEAIAPDLAQEEDFALVDALAELSKVQVPNAVEEIRTAEVLHKTVCEVEDMCKEVKGFLGI
jgi:threonine synthase